MKYTYQISFNGSDYLSLYPNTDLMMVGDWEEGTMIWREKISELKIAKALNDTVYDTLETYFEDETYFDTRIYVKVLKNAVQDSLHWFGIKWGKPNKELKTYEVQPNIYDLWAQHFEAVKDVPYPIAFVDGVVYSYYGESTTYPYVNQITVNDSRLREAINDIVNENTTFPSSDVVSSFMWQDAYEDASAVGTYQGMPKDYVTGKESYLSRAGVTGSRGKSFSDILEWLKIFRVRAFFDTNDKFRFEHISFFNDRLTDNAVDFSSYIKDYNESWSYENTSIPTLEILKMNKDDDSPEDFQDVAIKYSNVRNRPDAQTVDFTSSFYSDFTTMGVADDLAIFGATPNTAYKWFNIDMASLTEDGNSISAVSDTIGQYCGSNDFNCAIAGYSLTVNASVCSGDFNFYIVDRSTGTTISNVVSVTSTGETTGTLTTTATQPDAFLRIESTATGTLTAWITLDYEFRFAVPTIPGASSGNSVSNGAMSAANIVEAWWQDDRLSKKGVIFGSDYVFTSSQFNLRRETLKFHYSGVINPLYGFDDGTRVGKIEKWKRSLDTDFYEIDVIYQEDE